MKRSSTVIAAATALAATTIAVAAGVPAARADAGPAGPATASGAAASLAGSTAPFAAAQNALGAVPASSRLTIEVWLKPQTAAAENYATAVSTPGSPLFEHYLSPAAYTARFGATSQQASSVEAWLRSSGFTGVSADSGRDYVQATAAVSTIDAALKVQLDYYRSIASANAGQYRLRANDRPVSLPASVAASVLGVTGLDNAAPVSTYSRPAAAPPSASAGRQADRVPLLAVVRPALREPPAQAVRHHQLPDRRLRLLRRPAPRGLRVQPAQHRQGRDDRAGRGWPDPGHVRDPAGLRQGQPHRVPVAEPVRRALARPGIGLRRPVQRRGAARRRIVVRHGAAREPARGRRRLLQRRLLRAAGPLQRGHDHTQRHRRAPAGADRVQLLGGRRRGAAAQHAQHRARVPAAGRRRGRQHALLRGRQLRCGDPVERPVRHLGRRYHARHRPEGPAAVRDRLVNRLSVDVNNKWDIPG